MVERAGIELKNEAKGVAGIEMQAQHFTVFEYNIAEACFDKFRQA